MASRPFGWRPVPPSRIWICFFNDSFDEIHAASGCHNARTANAAENDDIFYAGDDALDYVERACRASSLLVFRQYCQLCPTNYYQSDK